MRTQTEINELITRLQEQKKTLPEFSIFGDNNWLGTDKMVDVLQGKYTDQDDIYLDEDSRDREITSQMLLALDWLNGDIEDDELI